MHRTVPAFQTARASLIALVFAWPAGRAGGANDALTVDFRFAPPWWQTAICLPDDWQKTLVGKDGALLYDFPGRYAGFKTRITCGVGSRTEWVRQELVSPRIPIVRTIRRSGPVEIVEEAFAVVTPGADAASPNGPPTLERIGATTTLLGWASPRSACDPAFRNIAVGWDQPVRYRFAAEKGMQYTVAFGLCEGHHSQAGQRILDLQIEGKSRRTVDMIAEAGQNIPALFALDASDENADGWIDLAVAAAPGSLDRNTILNVLWVFAGAEALPLDLLRLGRTARPPVLYADCGAAIVLPGAPRRDLVLVRLHNTGATETTLQPVVTMESEWEITEDRVEGCASIGSATALYCTHGISLWEPGAGRMTAQLAPMTLPPGGRQAFAVGVVRGKDRQRFPASTAEAEALRKQAAAYWQALNLPYGRMEVPDAGVQALLDASIRNIYQAREIKRGLPAFQVGPTCYRGLWVVDGSFLLEAVAFLGRTDEARRGIHYLLGFQRDDGAIMIMDGHWKETGIALWAVARHARLTNDRQWLAEVWPQVERGFAYIRAMRKAASADPRAPNAGLIPAGMSDGGLGGTYPEYTNVYWTMVGLRAAVDAARWLDKAAQADEWQREYEDFLAVFRRAAARDMRTDSAGTRYLPIRMRDDQNSAPQKAQWAFLHAVFPGRLFETHDPLVRGNMDMLRRVEQEGLVFGTGWLSDGIWNYFGSFYAHAWLWLGDGRKSAETLYAFANHASPLLAWREEQMPIGKGDQICGDMPHNWASAEFIRLVRHLLILERGEDLHVFEALPAEWLRPHATLRLRDVMTEFGPISLELRIDAGRTAARLRVEPPRRNPPRRILLHRDGWSAERGTSEVPIRNISEHVVALPPPDAPK